MCFYLLDAQNIKKDADFFIKFSTCKKYCRVTGRGMALWHVIVLLCKQHGQIRSSRGVLHRIADRLQYFFNLIQCCFFFFFCFNNNLQFQIIPKIGNSINARCDILPVKILSQLFYREVPVENRCVRVFSDRFWHPLQLFPTPVWSWKYYPFLPPCM